MSFSGDLLRRSHCPACGQSSVRASPLFEMPMLEETARVLQCSCGLIYKNLAPHLSTLKSIYSDHYVHFQDPNIVLRPADVNSAKQKLERCRTLLPKHAPKEGWTLLDVGCGAGYFVTMARDLGYAAEGIDTYLPKGLEKPYLHRRDLEDIPSESYDIVSLLNVAEHLADPKPFFTQVLRILRPQGVLLLTCPYGASLACHFYRERWIHMALDEHLLFWTPQSLLRLLRPLGFAGSGRYRIAGSPFPFGRVKRAPSFVLRVPCPNTGNRVTEHGARSTDSEFSWQSQLWKLARWIQTHEHTANIIRTLVHWTKSGDYLEYAIQKNRAR